MYENQRLLFLFINDNTGIIQIDSLITSHSLFVTTCVIYTHYIRQY